MCVEKKKWFNLVPLKKRASLEQFFPEKRERKSRRASRLLTIFHQRAQRHPAKFGFRSLDSDLPRRCGNVLENKTKKNPSKYQIIIFASYDIKPARHIIMSWTSNVMYHDKYGTYFLKSFMSSTRAPNLELRIS